MIKSIVEMEFMIKYDGKDLIKNFETWRMKLIQRFV
jgi:hypothetical protein